ncbi:MAG: DUF4124 domain-containing protein [Gammaproteobacteria bacterium]
MRHLSLLIVSGMLAIASGTVHAQKEVYRWVDSQGVVHFSDVPTDPGAEPTGVTTQGTDPQKVAARQQQLAEQYQADEQLAAVNAADQADARRQQEMAAKQRQIGCAAARKRLDTYTTAPRLYEKEPDGGRRYLTADEIDQARASAMDDVTSWCD